MFSGEKSTIILSLVMLSLLISHLKAFFISVTLFSVPQHFLLSLFLRVLISLLILLICSFILFTFPISVLIILIITILNSWPDNSNIPAYLILWLALSLQIVFLPFGMPCNVFLLAEHDTPGERKSW